MARLLLNGNGLSRDARGRRMVDHSFLLALNAHHGPLAFAVPARLGGSAWLRVLDTAALGREWEQGPRIAPGRRVSLAGRSLRLLVRLGQVQRPAEGASSAPA